VYGYTANAQPSETKPT
jgi:hypothetical protein